MTDHPTNQQATPMPWDEDEEDRLHDNAVAEAPVERDQAQGENVGLSMTDVAASDAENLDVGTDDQADAADRDLTQRERVIAVGSDAELWHDPDFSAFATVVVDGHVENHGLRTRGFRRWLLTEYGRQFRVNVSAGKSYPSAPSNQAWSEGLNTLEAMAGEGGEWQPRVRVGQFEGKVYIDLGTPDWSAVEIDGDGWRIVTEPPIKFFRPPGLRPLPKPNDQGNANKLRPFVNIGSDEDFMLLVGWLVGAFSPSGPYPILIVNGEQGSAKSTLCRVLRRLVDPNAAEVRSAPKDERDLVIAARNGWMVALDNLSYIGGTLSDAMCRVATGTGFATRTLYTNTEETIISVCRPQVVNGIPDLVARPDLADRAIALTLPSMPEGAHISEAEFWAKFDAEIPAILGGLFDAVACAIRHRPNLKIPKLPRMADFGRWVEAASPALGWEPGAFLHAYEKNRVESDISTIEADPVASAILDFVGTRGDWSGTASHLLKELNYHVSDETVNLRGWPKSPASLSNKVLRAAPSLRRLGITVERDRVGNAGERILSIRTRPKTSSAASASSAPDDNSLNDKDNPADDWCPWNNPADDADDADDHISPNDWETVL